ncbi:MULTISPECIES: Ig-like domain-containing protein [unclassified Marinobacter]|uniref:Ig-like domain-containing protein n=1 Tax=unclassified Marinobacter TaxID=83889 RepID=UPI0019290121|nr:MULTISPECIES: Ig-like domain-containing protein [unclassified Marinobacter]MBL3826296.1 Ig-like domain-containing protein [Marinobacter sp. MC3]MBL3894802.1 Ig-like domain-containing protein [Marinobacter sp. MW3]
MSGKLFARVTALLLTLVLAACGGDSGSSSLSGVGGGSGTGDTTTDPGTVQVGSIEIVASPVSLDTSTNAQSSITARVKDASGVLLEGVPVSFSATNGGTLAVSQGETDEAGVATATLTTDGDPRNRTVTVTAESGSFSDSVNISISGTSIAIAGPSSISLGASAALRVTLVDADGNGIPNEPINLSTDLGTLSASTLTTSANGFVDVQLNSGSTGGTATVTASAYSGSSTVSTTQNIVIAGDSFGFTSPAPNTEVDLNTPQTLTMEWLVNGNPVADGTQIQFSATRGTLDPANGVATTTGGIASIDISSANAGISTITASDPNSGLSADLTFEFVATMPDDINLQATKTQLDFGETSEIIAVIRDADNNLVKNQEVTFSIREDGSGGSLNSSRDVTDSQGRASTIYQAGANTSGRDGVEIQATVGGAISDTVTLTVARQALRLAIGTGNEIIEPDTVRYQKDYVAIVTDANGAPVENANIELSVLPTGYIKGSYVPTIEDTWAISPGNPVFCDAEDVNRNGQLDAGEDTNGSMSLEPTNSATTSASSIVSATDGSADFSLIYPQSHCNWVRVELTATVRVGGSESVESSEFFLSCAASDLDNTDIPPPGGIEGLYGSAQDCTVEN